MLVFDDMVSEYLGGTRGRAIVGLWSCRLYGWGLLGGGLGRSGGSSDRG